MSRPLRVDVHDGWYHVMSRGIEQRAIFPDESYYRHFLKLLGRMTDRYAVEVHAWVLMGNHYHILLRTPGANCSQAVQWLNVSYSVWFNRKRQRTGHVFQGRFKSVLIDGNGSWLLEASAYLHLNPVRRAGLGLGKSANRVEALGWTEPDRETIRARLRELRIYPWNSYRAYVGYASKQEWLSTEVLLVGKRTLGPYSQGDWRTCRRLGVQDGGPVHSTVQGKIAGRQINAQEDKPDSS